MITLKEQRAILRDCVKRAGGAVLTHYFANGCVGFIGPGGVAFEQGAGAFDPPIYSCFPVYQPGETGAAITAESVARALVLDDANQVVCSEMRAVQYVAQRRR